MSSGILGYNTEYINDVYEETIECENEGVSGEMISYQTREEKENGEDYTETLNCRSNGASGELISYQKTSETETIQTIENLDCSNGSKSGTAISYTQTSGTETISGDVMYFMDEDVGSDKVHTTDPDHGISAKEHMEFWLQSSEDGEMTRRFFSSYPATMTLTVRKAYTLNEFENNNWRDICWRLNGGKLWAVGIGNNSMYPLQSIDGISWSRLNDSDHKRYAICGKENLV